MECELKSEGVGDERFDAAGRYEDEQTDSEVGEELAGASSTSSQVQIFVSYRITPDQRVAAALKRLIETSIEPQPVVFVSGVGGLRPSSIGAIPQMQAAAESAQAFVGVITQASKSREWIFFEAGAAWGKRKLYAPLLVDTKPEDLPNTIEGYQATDAGDREQMRLLVTELANAVGASVRSHFGTRYAAFDRTLRNYPEVALDASKSAPGTADTDLDKAVRLLIDGRQAEANDCFTALELKHADDPRMLSELRLARVSYDGVMDHHEKLVQLELLATKEFVHPDLHFWLGCEEDRAHRRVLHFQKCLERTEKAFLRKLCTTSLAHALVATGRIDEAIGVLLDAFAGSDREMQAAAAIGLIEHCKPLPAPTRLLLGCHAFAVANKSGADALLKLVDLAASEGWTPLAIALGRRFDRTLSNGSSANQLGIVYQNAKLSSLAYQQYDKASGDGVSVAKANIANLVSYSPVAAAGLGIMEQHGGPFDSATPNFPHEVRARLVKEVHSEQSKADALEKTGAVAYHRLCELVDFARVPPPAQVPLLGEFLRSDVQYVSTMLPGGELQLASVEDEPKTTFTLLPARPLARTWFRAESPSTFAIYNQLEDGTLSGVRFDLANEETATSTDIFAPLTARSHVEVRCDPLCEANG